MLENQFGSTTRTGVTSYDAGLRDHMQRIYNRMTLGVLVTAVVAYVVGSSQELLSLFLNGPQRWLVMLAPLGIVMFGFNPTRMSSAALRISFLALSVVYGISFSAIFRVFTGESIANAFFVASGMFAGLSLFGYSTKKDLTGLGNFAVMGVWGALILGIINIFTQSSGLGNLISVVSIIAFAGITAWETQRMKEMYSDRSDPEMASRMSWLSALNLYVSFIAMFQSVLSLMGNRQ